MAQGNYPEDSRYAPTDYMPKGDGDLIDFPVSDTWRDYFFEKQMTPHPSASYYRDSEINELKAGIDRLRLALEGGLIRLKPTEIKRTPAGAKHSRKTTKGVEL